MVDVGMKIKFRIEKYSQVSNGVGPGYGGLTKFIIIIIIIIIIFNLFIYMLNSTDGGQLQSQHEYK
jgi:hypothetical protein